ncbi:beta-carotene isomerase D27, chloroplastic isoform X1 [Eutrema salsugineum]|uniref:beta-carotene isomerase D27, chloroplastic isoform X1 n=1 Tax=Eutrema salsugineum TaxID=72664 RepID=UPI000CED0152|nr:beta-carotene isomerase D27, chloroplastic isoform X1 [Eutrema salsugineum]
MALLLQVPPPTNVAFSYSSSPQSIPRARRVRCRVSDSSEVKFDEGASKSEYKPGVLDDFFMHSFRNKLVEEVGSDSEKPGYVGLIELVKLLLLKGRTRSETNDAAFFWWIQVRILKSLFPPLILELYKLLIAPIAQGKLAALMVARVTVLTCQWLMGPCKVNIIDLPNGESWDSGVFVEKCQYLEESKCVGVCIHTCKLPTQTFFKDYMGVPLLMEPNFKDHSCQFKFGVAPPEDDGNVSEPCLETCSIAGRRKLNPGECPMA